MDMKRPSKYGKFNDPSVAGPGAAGQQKTGRSQIRLLTLQQMAKTNSSGKMKGR